MRKAVESQKLKLFPAIRFHESFPFAYWVAGLWLYLKSFLYVCYLYMLGLEPPPYEAPVLFEIIYFAIAFVPAFVIALMLWNNRKWAQWAAIGFLLVDTPVFLIHVLRLAREGYLTSGLTTVLEYGSLGLNVLAVTWLIMHVSAAFTEE